MDSMDQKYVNLLSNSGFKAVFGDRNNKDVVMSVINMLLPQGKRVTEIEYAPTEHQGQLEMNKEFRYDFMCRGDDGSFFIVEVQSNPEEFWFKRCVSYASRVYDRQNKRGEEYDVPPVYLIGLMGIDVKHDNPELQDDTIFIIFAELRRFSKSLSECKDDLEKMLYIIKNCWQLQTQPVELQDEFFTKLFQACDIPRFDEAKRIQYEKDMFDERRYNGEINAARKEGREEGRLELCRNLLSQGVQKDQIALAAGLSIEELDVLVTPHDKAL